MADVRNKVERARRRARAIHRGGWQGHRHLADVRTRRGSARRVAASRGISRDEGVDAWAGAPHRTDGSGDVTAERLVHRSDADPPPRRLADASRHAAAVEGGWP